MEQAGKTIEEWAAINRVSGATVHRWIKSGRLPVRKMGKRTLIPAGACLDEKQNEEDQE